MALDHILLGLLRRPASGYALKKDFSSSLQHFWAAELAQIYPTLGRMEKDGLLSSRQQPSDKGPPRRVYSRTRKGERALHDWLVQGPESDRNRISYLAQVFFLGQLDDLAAARQFLGELRDEMATRLATLKGIEAGWAKQDPRYPDELPDEDFFPQLTLRMGLMKLAAGLEWCDESLRRLEQRMTRNHKQTGPAAAGP